MGTLDFGSCKCCQRIREIEAIWPDQRISALAQLTFGVRRYFPGTVPRYYRMMSRIPGRYPSEDATSRCDNQNCLCPDSAKRPQKRWQNHLHGDLALQPLKLSFHQQQRTEGLEDCKTVIGTLTGTLSWLISFSFRLNSHSPVTENISKIVVSLVIRGTINWVQLS